MFVMYSYCPESADGDAAGYVIATDKGHPSIVEEEATGTDCVWMIPSTFVAEAD